MNRLIRETVYECHDEVPIQINLLRHCRIIYDRMNRHANVVGFVCALLCGHD